MSGWLSNRPCSNQPRWSLSLRQTSDFCETSDLYDVWQVCVFWDKKAKSHCRADGFHQGPLAHSLNLQLLIPVHLEHLANRTRH